MSVVEPEGAAEQARVDAADFEHAYDRLEQIVRRLESGGLKLSEALEAYAEAVALLGRCRAILEHAEQRIELLLEDEQGRLVSQPVEGETLQRSARGQVVVEAAAHEDAEEDEA
ncbi:MAG: exodeoxyribonuclease VII small subunit [Planctomycetota bacterium]|nr:MAG: exodeoxyribonuclease VII small subunit [Planctomycetota bacterium]